MKLLDWKKVGQILGVYLVLMSILALFRRKQTQAVKRLNPIDPETGIAATERVMLNGVEQWVMIRGQNPNNPVLLFLHGGPGLTLMPYHHQNALLEKYFTVVHWDQRGAGKSYQPGLPVDAMSFDQLYTDSLALVYWLRGRFQKSKIYLAGHSLGSTIGLKLAAKHPELFHAYIGIGQVVHKQRGEALSYQYALEQAERKGDKRALKHLQQIGPPPYDYKAMLKERHMILKYHGNLYRSDNVLPLAKLAFACPEYSWRDLIRYLRGLHFSLKTLWGQAYDIDFFQQIPRVDIPVYFMEGRHDYVVPATLVAQYVNQLQAPKGKALIWYEQSGHWPQLEEPEKFQAVMIERVLKDTAAKKPLKLLKKAPAHA